MKAADSLNGSVHSQGIKIDHTDWLDIGSKGWQDTSGEQKAAAYQAAKVCGWTDDGMKRIMLSEFGPRIDEFMADVTLESLRELAAMFPVEVEQVYEVKKENPAFKVRGSEATFKLPENATNGERIEAALSEHTEASKTKWCEERDKPITPTSLGCCCVGCANSAVLGLGLTKTDWEAWKNARTPKV